jgi:hypothetical protein
LSYLPYLCNVRGQILKNLKIDQSTRENHVESGRRFLLALPNARKTEDTINHPGLADLAEPNKGTLIPCGSEPKPRENA